MDDDILVRGLHRDLVWFEMRYIHHHLFKNDNFNDYILLKNGTTDITWNDLSSSLTLDKSLPSSRSIRRIDLLIERGTML